MARGIRLEYLVLLLVVISACTAGINEQQAEDIAKKYVVDRVKFFADDEGVSVDLPEYTYDRIETSFVNGQYDVSLDVSAKLGNETKHGNILVSINSNGKVINIKKIT